MVELPELPMMEVETTKNSSSKKAIDIHGSYVPIGELGFLIRYEAHVSFTNDGVSSDICRYTYPIIRRTAYCDVIDVYGEEKFVLHGTGKRYAYPNDEQAIESLKKRTAWRMSYARNNLGRAEEAKRIVDEFVIKEKDA